VPGVPASCEKFPHSRQLNFWSTESIFNQFSMFLKTLNALCVCLQYKHPRSIKRVIRSDKPVTLLLLLWSHKCDFGAEPRSRIIATSAVKGLIIYSMQWYNYNDVMHFNTLKNNIHRYWHHNVCGTVMWHFDTHACIPFYFDQLHSTVMWSLRRWEQNVLKNSNLGDLYGSAYPALLAALA
jgi:hypothetical protein